MFFVGLVVMILLVMGGVEVNPGPPADQLKLDLILEHVKNQGHKTKMIREIMKAHSQKIDDTRKGTDYSGPKFDPLNEAINSVINDYNWIKLAIRSWEERQEVLDCKMQFLKDRYEEKNIIISGLEEKGDEGFFDILKVVVEFLRDTMKMDMSVSDTDKVFRLGKRRG
jgi:hypothetical protein